MPEKHLLPLNHRKQLPYLTRHTIGFINHYSDVESLLETLEKNGFSLNQVDVVSGQEGLDMVDLWGEKHSFYGKLLRAAERFWGAGEWIFLEIADKEIRKGHYLIIIETLDSFSKDKAILLLKKHTAHDIKYFSSIFVEHFSRKNMNDFTLDRNSE